MSEEKKSFPELIADIKNEIVDTIFENLTLESKNIIAALRLFLVAQDKSDTEIIGIIRDYIKNALSHRVFGEAAQKINNIMQKDVRVKKSEIKDAVAKSLFNMVSNKDFTKEYIVERYQEIIGSLANADYTKLVADLLSDKKAQIDAIVKDALPQLSRRRQLNFDIFWNCEIVIPVTKKGHLYLRPYAEEEAGLFLVILPFGLLVSAYQRSLEPLYFSLVVCFTIFIAWRPIGFLIPFVISKKNKQDRAFALQYMADEEKKLLPAAYIHKIKCYEDSGVFSPDRSCFSRFSRFLSLMCSSDVTVVPSLHVSSTYVGSEKVGPQHPKKPHEQKELYQNPDFNGSEAVVKNSVSDEVDLAHLANQLGYGNVDSQGCNTVFQVDSDMAESSYFLIDPALKNEVGDPRDWKNFKEAASRGSSKIKLMLKEVVDPGTAQKMKCYELKIGHRPQRLLGSWVQKRVGRVACNVLVFNTAVEKESGKSDRTKVPDRFKKALCGVPLRGELSAAAVSAADGRWRGDHDPGFWSRSSNDAAAHSPTKIRCLP